MRDNVVHSTYVGATDFYTESKTKSYPLTYNEAGSLVSDAGRDIAYIRYDYNNNPVLIVFKDGHETEYIYSTTGEKLRVIYTTAKPHVITREIGKDITERLPENYRVSTPETVDYLLGGALTLRNGVIDKYQFEEGYCQATPIYDDKKKPIAESFTFCYYDQDHLGNIRQVTMDDGSSKGEVIQTMDYYPFGAEFCNNSTKSYVQNHKYNGKELDLMHGLNTYDYGARQYNPITARWDRIDPLSEKYYSISPYVYCANNPIKYIDLHGDSLTLEGEANDVDLGVNIMNGSASSTYKNDNGNITISKLGKEENNYDIFFNKIINSDKNVTIKVVNNSEKVLIGDADAATIDVGDMNNLPNEDCFNPGSTFLHEVTEQFYIQAEGNTKYRAHKRASGAESSVGMYDIPEARPIDNDKGTLSVSAKHKLTGEEKPITIKIKNYNVVK